MSELKRWHFHIMEDLNPGDRKAFRLDTFRPPSPVKIVGAHMVLLTCSITSHHQANVEIYLAISNKDYEPKCDENWINMKQDYLFYSQRDVYSEATSADDLMQTIWLPDGTYYTAGPLTPVYVYVGAGSWWDKGMTAYDVMGSIYYVE